MDTLMGAEEAMDTVIPMAVAVLITAIRIT